MSCGNREFLSQQRLDERIACHVARRHGVFSLGEAKALGATKDVASRRVAAHRWERLHAAVYRLKGAPISWRSALLAACLAGTSASTSHRAAGELWRLAGFERHLLELTVPRGRRRQLPGVIVHQLPLPVVDVTVVDAIPVTTPARTLLDLASVCDADVVEEALDDAIRRGLVSLPRLRWRFDELGKRRGSATIRRLLNARTGPASTPRSVHETRVLRLIRRAGLPEPVRQYPVRERGRVVAVPDFAYPSLKVAIEADGYRWHSGRIRWQHDLTRGNELTRLGWRVIHVTAQDIERRPEETIRVIRAALGRT